MVDPATLRRAGFQALFAALAALLIFVRILPVQISAGTFPAPDLIALLAFAWILRRPDYVPVLLVAAVGLAADILLMQPLGLFALLLVLGTEFLRGRGHVSAQLPFPVEWTMVSCVLAAMAVAGVVAQGVLMAPQPPVRMLALQLVMSILAYPLVVLATAFGFGVRPPPPVGAEGA